MGPVAERGLVTMLTPAEKHATSLVSCVFNGRELGPLMATIAERLLAALPTGAPEIILALFDLHGERGFLCDDWL